MRDVGFLYTSNPKRYVIVNALVDISILIIRFLHPPVSLSPCKAETRPQTVDTVVSFRHISRITSFNCPQRLIFWQRLNRVQRIRPRRRHRAYEVCSERSSFLEIGGGKLYSKLWDKALDINCSKETHQSQEKDCSKPRITLEQRILIGLYIRWRYSTCFYRDVCCALKLSFLACTLPQLQT